MSHEAFLTAILAEPDSDAPRLVYADWLDERGDPHGELIRLQCAPLPEAAPSGRARKTRRSQPEAPPPDPERERRERELCEQFRDTLCKLGGTAVERDSITFARGFVAAVTINPAITGRNLRALAGHPLMALQPAGLPHWWGFATARSRGLLEARMAAASPYYLTAVTSLGLESTEMGDAAAAVLISAPTLVRLTQLNARSARLGDLFLRAVAKNPALANLEVLDLGGGADEGNGNDFTVAGLRALTRSPHLAKLTTLDLSHNFGLGDAIVRTLAAHPFPALTTLRLSSDGLTEAGIGRLAAAPWAARLKELDLENASPYGAGNDCGDAAALVLAQSPYLEKLERMHVGRYYAWRNLTDAGIQALTERFGEHVAIDPPM
jgi:uncharacterized protein (TIGR02996 family)